ncbi:MAG TPA: FkbM family methyltransferase [Alphaproteobacteria bacterium]
MRRPRRRPPIRLRETAVEWLARRKRGYRLFQKLGRLYRVQDIRVAGDYGPVEGALDDSGVLQVYARSGGWARTATRFFQEIFESAGGGSYLDIGANIGLMTIPIADNPRVACKAFEPAPRNFAYLERNIRANCPHGNVELFPLALFDRQTTVDFALSLENSGDNRIRLDRLTSDGDQAVKAIVRVPANRLDDVLDATSLRRPLVVKLIAQGAEGRIIAGGARVLGEAEALLLEFDPGLILALDSGIDAIVTFLREHFRTAALVEGRVSETATVDQPLLWRPVSEVIADLRTRVRDARAPGLAYAFLYARR